MHSHLQHSQLCMKFISPLILKQNWQCYEYACRLLDFLITILSIFCKYQFIYFSTCRKFRKILSPTFTSGRNLTIDKSRFFFFYRKTQILRLSHVRTQLYYKGQCIDFTVHFDSCDKEICLWPTLHSVLIQSSQTLGVRLFKNESYTAISSS